MRVALTAEGTYPYQLGGVSVWTDQLIRGLPDYDFLLVALVATGAEPMRWALPKNVSSVETIALWGPSSPIRPRLTRSPARPMLRKLIEVLLAPPTVAQDRFADVMYELFEYAQARNLPAALASEQAVRLLNEAWQERWPDPAAASRDLASAATKSARWSASAANVTPTVQDAVTAMQLIEHSLRPLSRPPVQADVMHTVTNGLGVLPALAAKWDHGTPVILTEHGLYMREQYMHIRRAAYRWPVKELLLRFLRRLCALGYAEADLITPGNGHNQRWEEMLGADPARICTIYNGVNPADFPAFDGEPPVPTIVWVGRVDPVKDLETLLRAFSLVAAQVPEARLRMFGSPPPGGEAYLERCRDLAAELGIAGEATFEGRVADVRDAYAAARVVVLSSITEGIPYTLIEAMACGRACVATDVGGVSEALAETGLTVPPRDPAALAEACLSLLQDPGLRWRLGSAARRRVLRHFTVKRATSAYDEIYTVLGSGLPVPAGTGREHYDKRHSRRGGVVSSQWSDGEAGLPAGREEDDPLPRERAEQDDALSPETV
jgi:glycosyltransferase involved in cell wall biosynthesis